MGSQRVGRDRAAFTFTFKGDFIKNDGRLLGREEANRMPTPRLLFVLWKDSPRHAVGVGLPQASQSTDAPEGHSGTSRGSVSEPRDTPERLQGDPEASVQSSRPRWQPQYSRGTKSRFCPKTRVGCSSLHQPQTADWRPRRWLCCLRG